MKCPDCGLDNPDTAQRCDCGYDFPKEPMIRAQNLVDQRLSGPIKYRFIKPPGRIVEKIVLINLFILFLVLFFGGPFIKLFALTPVLLFKGHVWQPLTYFFLHGGFSHFLQNTVLLWQLGSDVEEQKGWRFFLTLYILCGVGTGLVHVLLDADGSIGSIGSSGCIYGILVAYWFLFPNRYVFHRWIRFKFICPLLLLGGLDLFHIGGIVTGAIFMARNKSLEKQRTSAPAASIEPMFVSESEHWISRFRFHTPTAPVQPSWFWSLRIATLASLLALWASIYGLAASDPEYKIAYVLPTLIMAIPYIVILTFLRKNPPQANTLAMAVGIGSVTVFFAILIGSVSLGATHAALVVTATKTFYSLRKTRIESLRQQWPGDTSKLIVRSVVYVFFFSWWAFSAYLSLIQLFIELGRSL